jgi:ATP-dependent Clp protease ATP-binding subunit ClpB
MQADRFTVKSQEAIAAAQRLSAARHHSRMEPHHLLAALLEQEGGILAPVLERAGADVPTVRARTNAALDALPTVTGDTTDAPSLASETIDLLKVAEDEARKLGDEYVST